MRAQIPEGGGQGARIPGKPQVAIGVHSNIGKFAFRGRSVRPSVKCIDDLNKRVKMTLSRSNEIGT